MAISSNDGQVYNQLKKLFNLPESCRRIEIRMEVESLVEIECEYFPDEGTGETITQTFNLVPVESDVVDVTTLSSNAKEYRRIEPLDCVGVKADADTGKASWREYKRVPLRDD